MALEKFTSIGLRKEHYKADALILYCVDHRGKEAFDEFIRAKGFKYYDLIQIPGGAKGINEWYGRPILIEYIMILLKAHNAKRIIITTHRDCAAYGGTIGFESEESERKKQEQHLKDARDSLMLDCPDVLVEAYFVDYNGFWRVV